MRRLHGARDQNEWQLTVGKLHDERASLQPNRCVSTFFGSKFLQRQKRTT